MKVLYIHQYFLTPKEGGAIRSYYLAKGLVDAGHEVEMITAHNKKGYQSIEVEGVKVHYLPVYYSNKLGFFGRMYAFLKFIFLAYKKAKVIKGVDICYASSTPLTIGVIPLMLKRKYKIPYYFEVRDLWPEAPIQLGYIKNFFLKKYLRLFEKKIYDGADKIIALSPGIRDGIESVVPEKPIYVISNMADCSFFQKDFKDAQLEEKYNVRGKFVVSYFGAIGKVNQLEYLIDIIAQCKNKGREDLFFLVVGKGAELEKIKGLAKIMKLFNVRFIDYMDKYSLREILNITDAVYVSFSKKAILETNSPNKFFDALAAGKIIAVNSKGWLKQIVEEKNCGFYADPENTQEFIDKISSFIENPGLLIQYQNNSRRQAELYFSRDIQTQKFVKLFSKEGKMESSITSVYTLTA